MQSSEASEVGAIEGGLKHTRVAFAGYSRCGKDTAAMALIRRGYQRVSFGDIIKADLNGLVKAHLGFSAFTQIDAEKNKIRHLLEHWGDVAYASVFRRFFAEVPLYAVNTRIVRPAEALAWLELGGVIVYVERPGWHATTQWEQIALDDLKKSVGDRMTTMANDGTVEDLENKILEFVGINS